MSLIKTNARSSSALDATILTGNLPAISGASLTGLSGKVLGSKILFNSTSRTTWSSISGTQLSGTASDFYYPNNSSAVMEGSYTMQSASSNLYVWGFYTCFSSTNSHDAACWILGSESTARILHLDEHNHRRLYLASAFNCTFATPGTGSKTVKFCIGTGDTRSHSGVRGIVGSDPSSGDISENNGLSYLACMEVLD
jgi:hypothetical protein